MPAHRSGDRRTGPFWGFVAGRSDPPPVAALLGFELVAVDPDSGTIEVGFAATDQFLNPVGDVQGGILGAMLDDTLGPCLVATLGPEQRAPTLELHTQFLAPARVGRLVSATSTSAAICNSVVAFHLRSS